MKKRLLQSLLASIIVVSFSTPYVAPLGQENIIKNCTKTAVTRSELNITAGVSTILYGLTACKEEDYVVTIEENLNIKEWEVGWTKANVNVRQAPSLNSQILDILSFNSPIYFCKYSDEWAKVSYSSGIAYVNMNFISENECGYIEYSVPDNSGFKSYMPYTSITSRASPQYQLQQLANNGNYGIRQIKGRYCVAIGTAFNAQVGDYADLILENGKIIPIVVSDIKSEKDTEYNNIVTKYNGCVSEFIVDVSLLDRETKTTGDISSCNKEWDSPVVSIKIYEKNVLK